MMYELAHVMRKKGEILVQKFSKFCDEKDITEKILNRQKFRQKIFYR